MNEINRPETRTISTDEEAQEARQVNTDRNTQVSLSNVEDDNIKELLDLYPPDIRERLATSKYNVDRLIEALKDLRVDRTIPRICQGPRCPQADTCPLASIAPAGHPCPIEQILVKKDIEDYSTALEIDPMNRIEFDMVMELVEADVMDRRASADIAKNGYTQETVVAVVEQTGRPIVKTEKSIALDVKAFYKRQKEKIRNSLLATREAKAKAGVGKMIDPSRFSTELLERARDANATVVEEENTEEKKD